MNNGVENRGRCLSLKGLDAGGHLVEYDPEGEQIRAGVQGLAQCLFRRHVRNGPQGRAPAIKVVRRPRVAPESVAADAAFVSHGELRQTEIQNLGVAALGYKNICRLDVAVHDAMGVGGIKRVGDLDTEVQQLGQGQWTFRDALPERHAVQKLHRDKAPALRLTDFVNHTDVGMIQGRCGPRFPAESFQYRWVLGHEVGQKFERHQAAQLGVLSFVNHTHPAAPQLLDDAVVRDGMADHLGARMLRITNKVSQ